MKRNPIIGCAAIAALSFFVATAASAQDVKVAIVDVERALFASEEGKKVREELERKGREAEAELKPMVDRYKSLGEELEAKKFVLSEEALLEKRGELLNLEAGIKAKRQQLQSNLQVDQGLLLSPLQKKLAEAINAIGKEQGYTLILERKAQSLLYSREALDITDTVVARVNGG